MNRCEICGDALPEFVDPAYVANGNRMVIWYGKGPYAICAAHSTDEMLLWVAETLACDIDLARRYREKAMADRTSVYNLDGLVVEVTLPGPAMTGLEKSVREAREEAHEPI